MSERRRITVSYVGELALVRLNDRKIVDSANIEEMGIELCALVGEGSMKNILLNFDGVDFLSSAAVNKLILLDNKVKQVGGNLRLCNLRGEIREVFTLTRLNKVFHILDRFPEDDDLESWGAWVPKPTPPDGLDGRA